MNQTYKILSDFNQCIFHQYIFRFREIQFDITKNFFLRLMIMGVGLKVDVGSLQAQPRREERSVGRLLKEMGPVDCGE